MSINDPLYVALQYLNRFKDQATNTISNTAQSIADCDVAQQVNGWISRHKDLPLSFPAPLLHASPPPPPPSLSIYDRALNFVNRRENQKYLLLSIAGVSVLGYTILIKRHALKRHRPKRRAVKAPNGARTQIIVLAGSPAEPTMMLLANDLDKRGFIVYCTISSPNEAAIVERQNSVDIRCLQVSRDTEVNSFKPLSDLLVNSNGYYSLVGAILVPNLYFPPGPTESISVAVWSDIVYSLLGPIAFITTGLLDLVRSSHSRLILLTPNIISSMNPAFNAPECITISALSSLALCLHRELEPQGIPFIQIKMGSFDLGSPKSSASYSYANAIRADILSWPEPLRAIYARQYSASTSYLKSTHSGPSSSHGRANGCTIKELYFTVFDCLVNPSPSRVYHVGKGSKLYEVLGRWIPEFILGWLLKPVNGVVGNIQMEEMLRNC